MFPIAMNRDEIHMANMMFLKGFQDTVKEADFEPFLEGIQGTEVPSQEKTSEE